MEKIDNLGKKVMMGTKKLGQKLLGGAKYIGNKIWENKGKLLGGIGGLGLGIALGGFPKLEFSPQETESGGDRLVEWISRDLRKPITGDSPPPPTYSQLFPHTRAGPRQAQFF